jgi:AcrR family transcriptional regulator
LQTKKISPTLQRLLDTTKELIKEKGCKKTTMKDIIERSGVSKGGIYHYVESKDELLTFVLREQVERVHAQFYDTACESKEPFSLCVERLIAELYQLSAADGQVIQPILLYLLGKNDDLSARQAIRGFYRQLLQTTRRWIELGKRNGYCADWVDEERIADLLVLTSLGLHIRAGIPSEAGFFSTADFAKFIQGIVGKP